MLTSINKAKKIVLDDFYTFFVINVNPHYYNGFIEFYCTDTNDILFIWLHQTYLFVIRIFYLFFINNYKLFEVTVKTMRIKIYFSIIFTSYLIFLFFVNINYQYNKDSFYIVSFLIFYPINKFDYFIIISEQYLTRSTSFIIKLMYSEVLNKDLQMQFSYHWIDLLFDKAYLLLNLFSYTFYQIHVALLELFPK